MRFIGSWGWLKDDDGGGGGGGERREFGKGNGLGRNNGVYDIHDSGVAFERDMSQLWLQYLVSLVYPKGHSLAHSYHRELKL